MTQDIILTVIARDRPGLIKDLSQTIVSHGGNWIDSSMARLGGEFAGILRIAVPDENELALEAALGMLGDAGIWVTIRRDETLAPRASGRHVRVSMTGVDHPGIIQEVSSALAGMDISIDELQTRVFAGSMSGEAMFSAEADVVLPTNVDESALRARLEALAEDLMVDVDVAAAA